MNHTAIDTASAAPPLRRERPRSAVVSPPAVAEPAARACSAATSSRGDSAGGRQPRREEARAAIRVLVADDQVLIRSGLHVLLDSAEGIEVVGEAADGEEAIALSARLAPDVVLMDIRMPRLDGIEATRRISADDDLTGVKVVILTAFELDEYLFDGLRAGASGFMVKDTNPVELLHAVRVVARGDSMLSPGVTRRLIAEYAARSAERSPPPPALNRLTARERDIAALAGTGLSNDEIAERLFLSPATARTHVSRAIVKLHARDRAQLVVFAYEAGLVRPGWSNPAGWPGTPSSQTGGRRA